MLRVLFALMCIVGTVRFFLDAYKNDGMAPWTWLMLLAITGALHMLYTAIREVRRRPPVA